MDPDNSLKANESASIRPPAPVHQSETRARQMTFAGKARSALDKEREEQALKNSLASAAPLSLLDIAKVVPGRQKSLGAGSTSLSGSIKHSKSIELDTSSRQPTPPQAMPNVPTQPRVFRPSTLHAHVSGVHLQDRKTSVPHWRVISTSTPDSQFGIAENILQMETAPVFSQPEHKGVALTVDDEKKENIEEQNFAQDASHSSTRYSNSNDTDSESQYADDEDEGSQTEEQGDLMETSIILPLPSLQVQEPTPTYISHSPYYREQQPGFLHPKGKTAPKVIQSHTSPPKPSPQKGRDQEEIQKALMQDIPIGPTGRRGAISYQKTAKSDIVQDPQKFESTTPFTPASSISSLTEPPEVTPYTLLRAEVSAIQRHNPPQPVSWEKTMQFEEKPDRLWMMKQRNDVVRRLEMLELANCGSHALSTTFGKPEHNMFPHNQGDPQLTNINGNYRTLDDIRRTQLGKALGGFALKTGPEVEFESGDLNDPAYVRKLNDYYGKRGTVTIKILSEEQKQKLWEQKKREEEAGVVPDPDWNPWPYPTHGEEFGNKAVGLNIWRTVFNNLASYRKPFVTKQIPDETDVFNFLPRPPKVEKVSQPTLDEEIKYQSLHDDPYGRFFTHGNHEPYKPPPGLGGDACQEFSPMRNISSVSPPPGIIPLISPRLQTLTSTEKFIEPLRALETDPFIGTYEPALQEPGFTQYFGPRPLGSKYPPGGPHDVGRFWDPSNNSENSYRTANPAPKTPPGFGKGMINNLSNPPESLYRTPNPAPNTPPGFSKGINVLDNSPESFYRTPNHVLRTPPGFGGMSNNPSSLRGSMYRTPNLAPRTPPGFSKGMSSNGRVADLARPSSDVISTPPGLTRGLESNQKFTGLARPRMSTTTYLPGVAYEQRLMRAAAEERAAVEDGYGNDSNNRGLLFGSVIDNDD